MPPRYANLDEIPCNESAAHDSMITLRLPRSVHEELKEQADFLGVTLNALVLSKVVAEVWGCRLVDDGKNPKRRKAVFA